MHSPLNIPLAKNICGASSKSAGVKATPMQDAPPKTPNKVAKKVNIVELNAERIEKNKRINVIPHSDRLKLNSINDMVLLFPE